MHHSSGCLVRIASFSIGCWVCSHNPGTNQQPLINQKPNKDITSKQKRPLQVTLQRPFIYRLAYNLYIAGAEI